MGPAASRSRDRKPREVVARNLQQNRATVGAQWITFEKMVTFATTPDGVLEVQEVPRPSIELVGDGVRPLGNGANASVYTDVIYTSMERSSYAQRTYATCAARVHHLCVCSALHLNRPRTARSSRDVCARRVQVLPLEGPDAELGRQFTMLAEEGVVGMTLAPPHGFAADNADNLTTTYGVNLLELDVAHCHFEADSAGGWHSVVDRIEHGASWAASAEKFTRMPRPGEPFVPYLMNDSIKAEVLLFIEIGEGGAVPHTALACHSARSLGRRARR
jgi:hypothetical protein